jgi:hypothetical protein
MVVMFLHSTAMSKRLLALSLALSGLLGVVGCQKQENPALPSQIVRPGVSLSTQPRDPQALEDIRPELIELVKAGKISAAEAGTWLIEAKRRVGIPNPERTVGFDKMLKEAGVN